MNINQIKLEIHDIYKKGEKITTNLEPTDDSDVINKSYLDKKVSEKDGHFSIKAKDYNKIQLHYNKQS